ncbi:hypothetical protein GH714_018285 [Hevea brasiliensis]|uniref:Small-subunit processome Utp12 domain-containing protein n=1 Tax=Hevea brasiliensis TaxID=3981 RepID=A0A6A6MLH8_HEVBR|nr:hypothetical protein GH714_018285 [Hevea brasiliensis]
MKMPVALLLLLALINAIGINGEMSSGLCDYKPSLYPRPHSVSILEFGAVGDGKTLNTIAFQNAIFYLKSFADKGGAQLYVPPGKWLTGSFNLTSHLTLFLEKGAVILGSQGSVWWDSFNSHSLNYSRPHLVEFIESERLVVSNLTFLNAPAITFIQYIAGNLAKAYVIANNVLVQNMSLSAPPQSPYTIGIVPDSSNNVCIEDSIIEMGYDAIALKSGWDEYGISYDRATRDVHIRRVHIQSSSGSSIAFGSEMSGGISDVHVEQVHLYNSFSGIEFRTTKGRGGYIKGIYISDIEMENVNLAFGAIGDLGLHPDDNFDPNALPVLDQITLQNVTASTTSWICSSVIGFSESVFPEPCPELMNPIMVSSNIRDLLTAFSPSLDYFSISSGDGRIKIWDTVKGQVQTEFADITSDDANLYTRPERGHLSVDYTCMKWLSLDRKKKRKLGSSLLVLGTGSGDVLALDVSAGQLKWTLSDCHPGGVSAISFSTQDSCIYTAGADGMFCKIDPQTGNMLGKFRASTKAISSISVSPDGKILATAAAQLTVFNCSDHKRYRNFLISFASGSILCPPVFVYKIILPDLQGAVRAMIFTEDGKYILSSAIGERYIALWRTDGGKKQSASCVLAMEHPAVFLDSWRLENEGVDAGLCILAISETGVCYTWYGQSIEELRNAKPTKVAISNEESFSKIHKGALPTIFAAKLQGITKPMAAQVFIAYGLLVKPLFQKIVVHSGTDIKLNSSQDGVLLPMSQSLIKSKKGADIQNGVTALDRANVEDALLPIPKVSDFHGKRMMDKALINDSDEVMVDLIDDGTVEADTVMTSMEKHLRSLEIFGSKDDGMIRSTPVSAKFVGIDVEANIPQKKMRAAVLSLEPNNAYKLLEVLLAKWESRSCSGKYVLPWIYCILVNHGHYIMAQEKPDAQMLNSLLKITKSRGVAVQPLLQLSGRLQLVTAQIDKAAVNKAYVSLHNDQMDDDDDDNNDEDIDERLYGEENDESQLSSDDYN